MVPHVFNHPGIPSKDGRPYSISNAIAASAPGHPLWLHTLRKMKAMATDGDNKLLEGDEEDSSHSAVQNVLKTTGPKMLARSIRSFLEIWRDEMGDGDGGIRILHSDYLFRPWPKNKVVRENKNKPPPGGGKYL